MSYRHLVVVFNTLALLVPVLAFGQSHAAVRGHTLESVTGLTDPNAMNEEWQTPLMAAAYNADEKAVKDLIARKANVNVGSRFGMTALMYAKGLPVVSLLLAAGASVNDKDITGKTALYYSIMHADPDIARALIKAGANVNTKDDKGMSVLHLASLEFKAENFANKDAREAYRSRIRQVIDLLVSAGASEGSP